MHPRKYQHNIPYKDPAVVGRLGGGYPVPASGSYDSLYGIGIEGIGVYTGVDIDAPQSQGSQNAESGGEDVSPTTGAGPNMGVV